jgi:anti-sigma B factor antagonist
LAFEPCQFTAPIAPRNARDRRRIGAAGTCLGVRVGRNLAKTRNGGFAAPGSRLEPVSAVSGAGIGPGFPEILTPFCTGLTLLAAVFRAESFPPRFSLDGGMAEAIPSVSVTTQRDIRIVEFTNNKILDEANISEIGQTLTALVEENNPPRLLLDFSNVDHLSSAALGMLINLNSLIKQKNGQLRLAHIKPQIFEVFVITKLNKVFRIWPTRKEALDSFEQ